MKRRATPRALNSNPLFPPPRTHTHARTHRTRAQWFNLFNCRSIGRSWEPFANFKDSTYGIVIQLIIAVAHYLLVELGGSIMQTVPLTSLQWMSCIGIGLTSLLWGLLVNFFVPVVEDWVRAPTAVARVGKADKSA